MSQPPLASAATRLNCDCLSWVPCAPELLLVSLYELDSTSGARVGGLELFRFAGGQLRRVATFDAKAGVFRFSWIRVGGRPTLLLALTSGALGVLPFSATPPHFGALKEVAVSGALLTCVSSLPEGEPTSVVVGDSAGCVFEVDLAAAAVPQSWKAHALPGGATAEVWNVAHSGASAFASGGDDSALKLWDLRTTNGEGGKRPTGASNSHEAGVTAFVTGEAGKLVSGSYDEKIRITDLRAPTSALWASAKLGGGVWDLCRDPKSPQSLAAALMYAGWATATLGPSSLEIEKRQEYETEGLLYGVSLQEDSSLLATCAFYTNSVEIFDASS